ncbi:hypothetical protein [Streptomyces avicenniae]|uniref:hypothetical protein n=1 Tax=Streptomyces avicenniae TaxID=500153 RepID=UPI00069BA1AD|nr:hypothetical protein [Streptomyces avicenniae]
MTPDGPRLLLNAEAFGFGPAAAVALLAAELAPRCADLAYVGGGHTLDLQTTPPFAAVHDTSGLREGDVRALLHRLAPGFDLFLTAMDASTAALAREAGLRVAFYDALTWFWPDLPAAVRDADLYLAQDFFGVRERLAAEPRLHGRAVVVPPVTPPPLPRPLPGARRDGAHVLVNLGGLQNPLWTEGDAVAYARVVLAAVRASLPAGRRVVVTTSRAVAAALGDPDAVTRDHATVLRLMSTATHACMTPGLGNLNDAATTGVPTLWLPPANSSHHPQARLLAEHGLSDAALDWADIGRPVAYDGSDADVSQAIAETVRAVSADPRSRARLAARVAERTATLGATGRARGLADRFGHGGARQAADAVLRWCAARTPAGEAR